MNRNTQTATAMTGVVTAALLALAFSPPAAKADGAAFNNNCRTCHSVREGDNRVGPSLYKIIGRKAGTAPGYNAYSQGMTHSGITWDEATLDKFIENPDAVIPNNNMKPFKSVPDKAVRARIIRFLKSKS